MAYPTYPMIDLEIQSVDLQPSFLELTWSDETTSRFHYIWLRDNCLCDTCHHPQTHQKMVWLKNIQNNIRPRTVKNTTEIIDITWDENSLHHSHFDAAWLHAHCYSTERRVKRKFRPKLWDAKIANTLDALDYSHVFNGGQSELAMLQHVRDYGFVRLFNVPTDPDETEILGRRFGYPRETNWGITMDILVETNPTNIANTGAPIAPHTDDSFRYEMPGIEMFHCIEASQALGGESILVDGFNVAETLRAEDPFAFNLLTTYDAPQFALDTETELRARGKIFSLDRDGVVVGIRYCECTQAPLDLPEEQVIPFYDALRKLTELVERNSLIHKFRLYPGETVVFDNQRILHGRTEFNGRRRLRNVYIDRDSFHSRLRILGQKFRTNDCHFELPSGARH